MKSLLLRESQPDRTARAETKTFYACTVNFASVFFDRNEKPAKWPVSIVRIAAS
jgi:hypothetical protein